MPARSTVRTTLGVALLVLLSPDASEATQVEIKGVYCSGSPCPQPMELPADFPTRINLRGTRLGRLSSGLAVHTSGWPEASITVRLGRTSSDGSRRVVVLTSPGSVAPELTRFQLQFRTTTGQSVTAMAGRAPFEIKALPAPRPDLIIESVAIEGEASRPTGFKVRLINQGDGQADLEWSPSANNDMPGYPFVASNCYEAGPNVLEIGAVLGLVDPGASTTTTLALRDPDYRFPAGTNTCSFFFIWAEGQEAGEDDTNNDFRFTFTIPKEIGLPR